MRFCVPLAVFALTTLYAGAQSREPELATVLADLAKQSAEYQKTIPSFRLPGSGGRA